MFALPAGRQTHFIDLILSKRLVVNLTKAKDDATSHARTLQAQIDAFREKQDTTNQSQLSNEVQHLYEQMRLRDNRIQELVSGEVLDQIIVNTPCQVMGEEQSQRDMNSLKLEIQDLKKSLDAERTKPIPSRTSAVPLTGQAPGAVSSAFLSHFAMTLRKTQKPNMSDFWPMPVMSLVGGLFNVFGDCSTDSYDPEQEGKYTPPLVLEETDLWSITITLRIWSMASVKSRTRSKRRWPFYKLAVRTTVAAST